MRIEDPLPGTVVGETWRVERRLATRAVAGVYEAVHTRDGSYRVLEVLAGGHTPSDEAFEQFRRTTEAARALRHRGIVEVHETGRLPDGAAYVVTDYLDGEDLAARLERDGSLRWPDARRVLDDVGEALAAAHGAGILHRHLEPASIFLMRRPGRPERALLMHFGIAELTADDGRSAMRDTGAHPRQSAYEPPEKINGDPLDARSDVYSLAAILFEMVTGAPPFTGPNAPAILARVLTEEVPDVAAYARQPVPTGLGDLLRRALAKDPAERPPDVTTLCKKVQSLEALQSWTWPSGAEIGAPVRRSPPPPGPDDDADERPPVSEVPARRPGPPLLAIALGVALVIIAVDLAVAAL